MYSLDIKTGTSSLLFMTVLCFILLVACNQPPTTNNVTPSRQASEISVTETPGPTSTPMDAPSQSVAITPSESTVSDESTKDIVDAPTVLDKARTNLMAATGYKAVQEYIFRTYPDNSEASNSSEISINLICSMDQLEKSSYCESRVEIFNDGTVTRINSETIKREGNYWFRRQGEEWQAISEFDARSPGKVEGIINPGEFLGAIITTSFGDAVVLPQGTFTKVVFSADAESFMSKMLGAEEGTDLYNQGENHEVSGFILVSQDDELIYEYSATLNFELNGTPMQINLTQSLSDFNEPVEIPELDE